MRDIGPTFVIGPPTALRPASTGCSTAGARRPGPPGTNDAQVAPAVCREADVPVVTSPLVNEGGGIHVNGAGTVLLTRTVQLGEGRNAHWSQQQVEDELSRTLGVDRFVWLERGLTRDYDEFGTRGHVDIVACFSDETTVLFHDQRDPEHPDQRSAPRSGALPRGRAGPARGRRARTRRAFGTTRAGSTTPTSTTTSATAPSSCAPSTTRATSGPRPSCATPTPVARSCSSTRGRCSPAAAASTASRSSSRVARDLA